MFYIRGRVNKGWREVRGREEGGEGEGGGGEGEGGEKVLCFT